MSNQSIRQSEIFSGEDWTVLYRAFTQINFNAYDPASINAALRNYVQANYPEDFNDWIESSEFVAIIDLLSWLAGSLAFRTDVNARENFLESAEARESVLRLARFLSYNPRRAQSARGLVKIVDIRTTEIIEDSFGVQLSNQTIKWNDPDNPDWFEQFTLVLNAAFPTTNPYGIPLKTATLGDAPAHLYRIECVPNPSCVYSFDATIDGDNQPFEVVNMDIESEVGYYERSPNPDNAFHLVYKNDGRGNGSARTGFFMLTKQGVLGSQDFGISNPVENRLLEIGSTNVSETDIWTQTLNTDESIDIQWTKVPAMFSENITFNSISPSVRNIFSVITRDNDRVTLRFGDGRFGDVPVGDLRVWYRTVNGMQYQVRPRDMTNKKIQIPYKDLAGRTYYLTMTFSLQEAINNAVGPETIDQVRRRAPQVYGAQNRMVSGEDYNVFPLSSNNVVKMRAVNRMYSGHSRYMDINDPTSSYQDTVVFSDDGAIYKEPVTQYVQVPTTTNVSPEQIVSRKIQPLLDSLSLRDYFMDYLVSNVNNEVNNELQVGTPSALPEAVWHYTSGLGFSSNGYMTFPRLLKAQEMNNPSHIKTAQDKIDMLEKFFTVGSMIKFRNPSIDSKETKWATVMSTDVTSVNFQDITKATSTIILNETVPDGWLIVQIVPPFRNTLDNRAIVHLSGDSEILRLRQNIQDRKPFMLWYQYGAKSSLQFGTTELPGRWIVQDLGATKPLEAKLVMTARYVGGQFWSFDINIGLRFVFESLKDVRWANLRNHKVIDATTGNQQRDRITLIDGLLNEKKMSFDVMDNVYDPDGYPDLKRVVITPSDKDDDGAVDDPDSFNKVISLSAIKQVRFVDDLESKYQGKRVAGDSDKVSSSDVYKPGVPNLRFQWKHFANTDVRIDPAITNIIDIFVLTREYDYLVRQWISAGSIPADVPLEPTDLELKAQFSEFEQYKMFSDEVVWRPVKYKYLFGEMAKPELKAQFKVIPLPNSPLSHGEIQSKVIAAINNYFDVNKWEFGETFYFTELAAYIHMQLATAISSVVIVPLSNAGKFGELFEIRSGSDEVFISTAQVNDVVIIDGNTMSNLRIS
jgi:hypothetical protein